MALYDVIDDIAKKQITKTDTGDNRIFGVVIGRVVKNYSDKMPGRVCVVIPTRNAKNKQTDDTASQLKWARVAMPSSGSEWGHYFLPEVGDQVLVVFEQGNIEKPYVIGCIPKDNNKFLKNCVDKDNQKKKIITRYGNSIIFEDIVKDEKEEGDPGDKDRITIITSLDSHKIVLDNEKKTITISDKTGKTSVTMYTDQEKSTIDIKAEKKLKAKIGDIELIMSSDGSDSGATTLKTGKFTVEASDSVNINASKSVKISGSGIDISTSGGLKLEGGTATLSGQTVSIG